MALILVKPVAGLDPKRQSNLLEFTLHFLVHSTMPKSIGCGKAPKSAVSCPTPVLEGKRVWPQGLVLFVVSLGVFCFLLTRGFVRTPFFFLASGCSSS